MGTIVINLSIKKYSRIFLLVINLASMSALAENGIVVKTNICRGKNVIIEGDSWGDYYAMAYSHGGLYLEKGDIVEANRDFDSIFDIKLKKLNKQYNISNEEYSYFTSEGRFNSIDEAFKKLCKLLR